MPQMGESIAEGTVSKWLKQVGDPVERDEPILEISTDKVDAEIPSPESGTLVEVSIQEGETVEVGTVVAYIDTEVGAAITPTSGETGAPILVADADDAKSAPEGSQPDSGPADASAAPVGVEVSSSDGHAAQAASQGGARRVSRRRQRSEYKRDRPRL